MSHRIFGTHPALKRESVRIDWLAFPHIFEAILTYADDASLGVLRQTCRTVRQKAYARLLEHVALVPRTLSKDVRGAALISAGGVPLFRDCEAVWRCECDSAALQSGAHGRGTAAAAAAWSTPTTRVEVIGSVSANYVAALVRTMTTAPEWTLSLRTGPLDVHFVIPGIHIPNLEVHLDLLDACTPGYAPMISSDHTVVHLYFCPNDVAVDGKRRCKGQVAYLAECTGEITVVFHPETSEGKQSKGCLAWLWSDLLVSSRYPQYTIVNAESLPAEWMEGRPSIDSRGRARRSIASHAPFWWDEGIFNDKFQFLSMEEYEVEIAGKPGSS
ncbi:hypothetical protein CcaverHIS002_0113220 [Cutaneotrichosporon cavernicola]|uniref:Uncharacterized protein n=1 Tax=Cutaneotrichosporon cavernicola TaxID=279322 RepID=A0AA48ICW4_9TREE|nr:uncharacterized protein CcaverHIS019_0113090 [Cutaneotrichosporon cavernicola]BEI80793.1 hypothetical protein CcaverHIS002_0113220 [Cutaneotrichosporon cavernicola]BEI88591.1 hypothetical protein CcaverHIS019_0113090 [Cutaneotrichosporon cavernicola]BEI96364.1 hypothetical protein CcaverHIS631_0113130 [Cutaneotrichosporon cavernicola]BEJ04136.1 hypothetical protein CcaverHIS641_0113110 [Cutaneotrichosporon cavernicola]